MGAQRSLAETTAAAPVEPISLAEAKLHLRIPHDLEDSRIASLITAARMHAEVFTRRALVPREFALRLDAFPVKPSTPIILPNAPLTTVESVAYTDAAGDAQTLSVGTEVLVDLDSEPGALCLPYGGSWPSTRGMFDSVVISYSAGYGDEDDPRERSCPEPIRQAMLLFVGHWFEHREEVITGTIATVLPSASRSLLWPYRLVELA